MPVLIAQILCEVEVKKSSVALGVAYGNRNVNATIKNAIMQNKKRAKGTQHQADNLAKLWQEFLSLPVLIAQILCEVEVKKI